MLQEQQPCACSSLSVVSWLIIQLIHAKHMHAKLTNPTIDWFLGLTDDDGCDDCA
jgi:hypothetical protein